MKPTATKCHTGGRHHWTHVWMEYEYGEKHEIKWCAKCGCQTEFHNKRRCEEDGKPYVLIPSVYEK